MDANGKPTCTQDILNIYNESTGSNVTLDGVPAGVVEFADGLVEKDPLIVPHVITGWHKYAEMKKDWPKNQTLFSLGIEFLTIAMLRLNDCGCPACLAGVMDLNNRLPNVLDALLQHHVSTLVASGRARIIGMQVIDNDEDEDDGVPKTQDGATVN